VRVAVLVMALVIAHGANAAAPVGSRTPPTTSAVLVLRGMTLVDGRGGPPLRDAAVVVRDGRIEQVGAAARVAIPPGATVLELAGASVIPGLVDAHVHVATDPDGFDADARERLTRAFRGGVTLVRDMGGDAVVLRELARWGADPSVPAPGLRYSALFAGPGFFSDPRVEASAHDGMPGAVPWQCAVRRQTNLRAAIGAARDAGASAVKIYADLMPDDIASIAREARRQGLMVWGHATVYPTIPNEVVDAGMQVLSHAMYLMWEFRTPMPGSYHAGRDSLRAMRVAPPTDSARLVTLFDTMASRGVLLEPTLCVTDSGTSLEVLGGWCTDVVRLAHARGVPLVAGTDNLIRRDQSAPNLHRELALLVAAGLTPLEAITAATLNGARAIGAERTHGSVERGKVADLVVLDGDPTADIANTRRVRMVIKGGRVPAPTQLSSNP
jgi:imidazolonepropionase-like amidohydrolase